jgi:peptide/nickel transport system substrate-binding protein
MKWSDDGLQLIVTLRPNVVMHDGSRLDAKRAAAILEALVTNPDAVKDYPGLADVSAVTADDARVIRFALRRHAAWLPDDLSVSLNIANPENLKITDPTKPKLPKIGTGPYRVVSKDGNTWVLERFDQYYGGKPWIKRVTLRPAETLRIAWASLLRREVDMVTDLPPDSIELIENDTVRVISFPRSYEYLIAFNGRSAKFADPRIRRALNMAIDRDAIVRGILKNSGAPASGPIWSKHWAYDPSAGTYQYDPRAASALLDTAGLHLRDSRDTALAPSRLRITCVVPAGFSILEQVALEVQRQLSAIGVDLQFDVQPYEIYDARVRRGDFETAMIDLVGGPTLSRASIMWRSPKRGDVYQIFNYENPATEALFETLRTAPNDAVTRVEVRKLQQAFLDSPPAIFLAWNERARAIRSDFGVNVAMGTDPLTTIWQWGADKSEGKVSNMAAR